uniref:Ldh_1_C domain-containing protein n=1 Tax=Mesocestoides corti TaxID=53468 RepID=A0A5K3FPK0_MESCO
ILESAAFRVSIGQKLSISPHTIEGCVLGEHGPNSVPIFSSVVCGSTRIRKVYPSFGTEKDNEGYEKIPENVDTNIRFINKHKGSCSWSLGLIVCHICEVILNDGNIILPLSTHAKHDGLLKNVPGIDKDIFISLPCLVNSNGVRGVMFQDLADDEKDKLYKSAKEIETLILSI